jgi:UDP-4-amino-4,6-dideoxy-N-acetyl-beta-L-altrosamine transaminase
VIPYGRQDISEADIARVVEALRSDFLTQGPVVPRFEAAMAARGGAAHGVAFSSATAALHGACHALGLGPGDRLWTVPNSFVASANCARYLGAEVDFVDIELETGCLSVAALAAKLAAAKRDETLPKVLVPVHFAGRPCDMAEIAALARAYGVRVLSDASHAVGATYRDRPLGQDGCSDVTVYSFHPVKIVTTGEGGMAVTDDPELAAGMARFRSHGIVRAPADLETPPDGPWSYEQQELGYNYRLTDIQAALGLSQLERLDEFLARRAALAARYDSLLAELPLHLPRVGPERSSSWHLYVVRLAERAPLDRATLFEALHARGIGVQVHYIPIHTQPYYRRLGFAWGDFPEAEAHYRTALSLPLYPALRESQQDEVVAALRDLIPAPAALAASVS